MKVRSIYCPGCSAGVEGDFDLPRLASLSAEDSQLLLSFLAARGDVAEVGRRLGISAVVVDERLEALSLRLGLGAGGAEVQRQRCEVLERLERGEITAHEAVALLRDIER